MQAAESNRGSPPLSGLWPELAKEPRVRVLAVPALEPMVPVAVPVRLARSEHSLLVEQLVPVPAAQLVERALQQVQKERASEVYGARRDRVLVLRPSHTGLRDY
jgi:hypothetical protein